MKKNLKYTKMKKEIKYTTYEEGDDLVIRVEDGGIAVIRHNQENFVTDLYQSRDKNENPDWEKLSEGKMYCKDWDAEKEEIEVPMIMHALDWLVLNNGKVRFKQIEKNSLKFT